MMFEKIKSFLFKNTSARQTVAKNTIWLTVSNFGGRLIKATVILYAARVLSTDGYGLFSYATTLAGFFTIFIDPGINAMVMREIPKAAEDKQKEFLSTTFVIKVGLIVGGVLLVLFVAPFFSTLPGAKALLPLVALIIACDTFREYFSAFMRAREKMEWEATIFLFTNLAIVIAGFTFLYFSKTPEAFTLGYVVGAMCGTLVAAWVFYPYLKGILAHFSSRLVVPIMRSAWPFLVVGGLGVLLTTADVLIISWMRGASDVGIYSAAVRIVQVLYVAPVVLQFSTLPLISRLANTDDERFRLIFERSLAIIFLASIPLALGGAVLGTPLMHLIFGAAYVPGSASFKVLMLTLLFDFPLTLISAGIFAYDRQKSLIISSAIGGIGNVVLDLALIPFFGITGSAFATLFAQAATTWYLWHTMKKINNFKVLPRLKRVAVASFTMAIAAFVFLTLGVNVIVNVVLCVAIYFLILYLLKEPLLKEVLQGVRPIPVGASTSGE